jgi:hypothetical protein
MDPLIAATFTLVGALLGTTTTGAMRLFIKRHEEIRAARREARLMLDELVFDYHRIENALKSDSANPLRNLRLDRWRGRDMLAGRLRDDPYATLHWSYRLIEDLSRLPEYKAQDSLDDCEWTVGDAALDAIIDSMIVVAGVSIRGPQRRPFRRAWWWMRFRLRPPGDDPRSLVPVE